MRDGLINPTTELVSRQLATVGAVVVAFIAVLFPVYHVYSQDDRLLPNPVQLDNMHLSAASAAATATEIVVVLPSGPPVTMTPKPNAPTVTG